jgi:hypothetical protein
MIIKIVIVISVALNGSGSNKGSWITIVKRKIHLLWLSLSNQWPK